ncbi:hypothetical protein QVD17_21276 [Tagetes erecta]|uniref:Uncharacterized protein n=1 Tax=Tagetes erecta TaxID=13708 RepID=A0AAD8NXY0_TARER|nr:hypothetical protein QVD17_21276 [Tagetes erecta]
MMVVDGGGGGEGVVDRGEEIVTVCGGVVMVATENVEKVYLVDHRWWNEMRESMFKEMDWVLHTTSCCLYDVFKLKIVLDMVRSESNGDDDYNGEEKGFWGPLKSDNKTNL